MVDNEQEQKIKNQLPLAGDVYAEYNTREFASCRTNAVAGLLLGVDERQVELDLQ